jgi:hypothetical protein
MLLNDEIKFVIQANNTSGCLLHKLISRRPSDTSKWFDGRAVSISAKLALVDLLALSYRPLSRIERPRLMINLGLFCSYRTFQTSPYGCCFDVIYK